MTVYTFHYDLDPDTTLGGDNASDYIIPSQSAIKYYVDHSSGGIVVDQTFDPTSINAQSGVAVGGELTKYQRSLVAGNYVKLENAWGTTNISYVSGAGSISTESGLVYDGQKYILMFRGGYISTSTDGVTWTTPTKQDTLYNLVSDNIWSLAYAGGLYIAFTYNGKVATSPDLSTWTVSSSDLGSHGWKSIAYNGSIYVMAGSNTWIATSTDGTTWTTSQVSTLGNRSYTITYNPDSNIFLMLSYGNSSGYISTSTNGTTWTTPQYNSVLANNSFIVFLSYDTTNHRYLAANSRNKSIITSTNGTTWISTPLNCPISPYNMLSVDGKLIGAYSYSVQYQTDSILITTTYKAGDGINIQSDGTIINTASITYWGQIQGNVEDQLDLQTKLDGKQNILIAGDNITLTAGSSSYWTSAEIAEVLHKDYAEPTAVLHYDTWYILLTHSGDTYIGDSYDDMIHWNLYRSTDGHNTANWYAMTLLEDPNNSQTKAVAINSDGTASSYMSLSGGFSSWVASAISLGSYSWRALAYSPDNDILVALGTNGYISTSDITSIESGTWSLYGQNTELSPYTWYSLAYGNGKFVALGADVNAEEVYISTSIDGTTWTTPVYVSNLIFSYNYISAQNLAIAYTGTKFIFLNASGYTAESTDGITWTVAEQHEQLSNMSNCWACIAFGETQYSNITGLAFSNDIYYSYSLSQPATIISSTGGTVDQTYDGTSANPQSGVAIEGELTTNYQPKLVSGTNIKTINNQSILGSGDLSINADNIFWATYGTTTFIDIMTAINAGKLVLCRDIDLSNNDYVYTYRSHTNTTITFYNVSSSSNTIVIVDSSNNWDLVDASFLPDQTSQSGKFLTTNGTTASWATVTIPTPTYNAVNERITW